MILGYATLKTNNHVTQSLSSVNRSLRPLIVLLLLASQLLLFAQTKIVVDIDTKKPIGDVFIFIDNSSTGTSTNIDGRYSLNVDSNSEQTIVFSHINYDIQRIKINEKYLQADTIKLQPYTQLIDEVSIVEKKRSKNRNKRIQRFSDAFLGYSVNKNLVKITNSEKILFRENNNKLQAVIKEPINIINEQLGYTIKFYLEQFILYDNDDLFIKGSAFFEDMVGKRKKIARFKRNRKKLFEKTNRKFFNGLISKDLAPDKYLTGYSSLNQNRVFVNFTEVQIDSLDLIKDENGLYILNIQQYFTIVIKDLPIYPNNGNALSPNFSTGVKSVDDTKFKFATSYIKSKSNKIILDQSGRILNPLELEEYGYWSEQRIADLLPNDYNN